MIRGAVAALLTLAAAPAAVTAQEVAPEWTSPEHVAADVAAATRRSDRETPLVAGEEASATMFGDVIMM